LFAVAKEEQLSLFSWIPSSGFGGKEKFVIDKITLFLYKEMLKNIPPR